MRKVILCAFMLFLAGGAFALEAQNRGYISVDVEASEELSPTMVKISFAIETRSKDPKEAAELNKEASKRAIDAVKNLVEEQKGENIKTTSYYLNPEHIYKDNQRKLIGYIASNTLQVTLKDVEKAGKIISTALNNGANSVNNLQFTLDESNEDCNRLIKTASSGAKDRALKIAESMGTSITGIKSLNASCSSNQSFSSNFRYMKSQTADEAGISNGASVPVEAGKTMLRANVNADFYVK